MKKLTTKEFIEKAKAIHGSKYDYSKVEYNGIKERVIIICPKHGEFKQTPDNHINKNHPQGCPYCANNIKKTTSQFIIDAQKVHGFKYDYSKAEYVSANHKLTIICPKHGEFEQTPHAHLTNKGCPMCGNEKIAEQRLMTTNEFIEKSLAVHGKKYDYSAVVYTNHSTKVSIICPSHGIFLQKPSEHLQGEGCPICNESILERDLRILFDSNNIEYYYRAKKDILPWIGRQELDFFIPSKGIAIECQGIQHFQPIKHFGGEPIFEQTVKRDKLKLDLCNKHGIKLLYYSNLNIDYPYNVIEEKEEIMKELSKP